MVNKIAITKHKATSFEVGDGNTTIDSINGSKLALQLNDLAIDIHVLSDVIQDQFIPALLYAVEQISFLARDISLSDMVDYDLPWEVYP